MTVCLILVIRFFKMIKLYSESSFWILFFVELKISL